MRAKLDAVRFDFANFGEAEDLEAAAVSEDGAGAIDELMQTARGLDDLQAGPDEQMVGVAQNDLGAHLAQLAWIKRFDAALRADRHKDRRIDDAAPRHETAKASERAF